MSISTAGFRQRCYVVLGAAALLLAAGAATAVAATAAGTTEDHSQHGGASADGGHSGHGDHAGHQMDTGRDDLGRRLWGQTHAMSPAMYDELRAKIPLYKGATKATIDMTMVQMGPEYQWYISPATLKSDAGVLIMSHGFREQGDKMFRQSLADIANAVPTSLSLGMGMMMSDHVQLSINDLEAAGVDKIVVVPIVSNRYNELMRQWEYILGQRDTAEFVTVPQVKSKARIYLAKPPEDDPLIAEIIHDHALEISKNPAKDFVIIVAHGASGKDAAVDNPKEMAILETLARYVKEDGGFADVKAALLQDDAPAAVREVNVQRLRAMAQGALDKGQSVLIVTNLIGARTLQPKLRADLKGIDYTFNAKGISQHPNFVEWIGEAVREVLEKPAKDDGKKIADNR